MPPFPSGKFIRGNDLDLFFSNFARLYHGKSRSSHHLGKNVLELFPSIVAKQIQDKVGGRLVPARFGIRAGTSN